MGHIRLGVLPSSRAWRDVVGLLDGGAPAEEVISSAALAAGSELARAPNDGTFVECLRLLAAIPVAARDPDFGGALKRTNLPVPPDPMVLDIASAIGRRLDDHAMTVRNTDFGELSRRALIATMTEALSDGLPGLLEPTPDDVRIAARRLSSPRQFAVLARVFFSRLIAGSLSNWLDRTLALQVGPGRRYAHLGERAVFEDALLQYSWETTRIIKEFSAGWFGKRLHLEGAHSAEACAGYGAIAFRKVADELERKQDADA